MKRVNFEFILIVVIFITACARTTEREFYDTGQLKVEKMYKKDTSNYIITDYYISGDVKSKGQVINGRRVGLWKEWYSDGSVKWSGEYGNGKRNASIFPSRTPSIIMDYSTLRKGNPTNMRVHIEGVHPEDMAVGCNNGVIHVSKKKHLYDYEVIPEKEGSIKFVFFIKNNGRMVKVGVDSLYVSE